MKIILILKLTVMKKNEIDVNRFSKRKAGIRKETNNAVIYTRVSSKDQADNNSLEVQLKATREYATRNNLIVKEIFGNTYESATSDIDRKEFRRMIKYAKEPKNEIKYIIVHTMDRFSRTGGSAIDLIEKLITNHNIQVLDIGSAASPNSQPSERFAQKMMLVVGNFDNENRREKCRLGTERALLNGNWPFKVPFGYNSVTTGRKRIITINHEGTILKKAFYWRLNEGLSMKEISEKLFRMGLKSLNPKRLLECFENPFYAGKITSLYISEKIVDGNHPALIPVEDWVRVQDIAESNKKNNIIDLKPQKAFPLIGTVMCSTCGYNLTGYQKVKKGKSYYYYKCNTKGCNLNISASYMHDLFSTFLRQLSLPSWLKPLLSKVVLKTFEKLNSDRVDSLQLLKENLQAQEKKKSSLIDKFVTDKINDQVFSQYLPEIEKEIALIKEQIANLSGIMNFDLSNFLSYALKLSNNLAQTYQQGTFQTRRSMQKLIFPERVLYDRVNRGYRTSKINAFFDLINRLSVTYGKEKSERESFETNSSAYVPSAGIEPAQFPIGV